MSNRHVGHVCDRQSCLLIVVRLGMDQWTERSASRVEFLGFRNGPYRNHHIQSKTRKGLLSTTAVSCFFNPLFLGPFRVYTCVEDRAAAMKRKWKITIIAWVGIILLFGIGSRYPRQVDLVIITLRCGFALVGSVYILAIWLRDPGNGEADTATKLSALPIAIRRFLLDDQTGEE
jgi:hypothetical protein